MDRNIFEAASKELKKKEKSGGSPPASNVPASPDLPTKQVPLQSGYGAADPDVMEMLHKIREMQRDLDSSMNELREKGKSYHVDVDKFVETSNRLNPVEYEKMKKEEQKFIDRVNEIFPPEANIKKVPKSSDQMTHERKGKTLGGRKKWIPMR